MALYSIYTIRVAEEEGLGEGGAPFYLFREGGLSPLNFLDNSDFSWLFVYIWLYFSIYTTRVVEEEGQGDGGAPFYLCGEGGPSPLNFLDNSDFSR